MFKNECVVVVDDHDSVRRSVSRLLESEGLWVDSYSSAEEFLACGRPEGPACLVLDVRMPGKSGLELQEHLQHSDSPIPIVFITGHGDVPMTVRAMKTGAVDFLMKPFDDEDLIGAVRRGLEADRRDAQLRVQRKRAHDGYRKLTPREKQVMAFVVKGRLNKQIALELGISEKTVKVHRGQVMKKMAAESVPDLVRMKALVAD